MTVMFEAKLCWLLYDGDSFKILVIFSMKESVTQISNLSPETSVISIWCFGHALMARACLHQSLKTRTGQFSIETVKHRLYFIRSESESSSQGIFGICSMPTRS